MLFVAAGAALSGVGVLLVVADRALTRRGRIAAAAQKDEMLSVRDQVLRYELDHGDLPEPLDDLAKISTTLSGADHLGRESSHVRLSVTPHGADCVGSAERN